MTSMSLGIRSPSPNPTPADIAPITNISIPCRNGERCTNRPLPTPRMNSPASAAEIEIVPFKVAEYISNKVEIFMIGMGSGLGCDAQYLFSEDILGYNKGHIPRHAKVYTNLSEDYEKIKSKSVLAYKKFKEDVISKKYPENKHDINISDKEFDKFIKNY